MIDRPETRGGDTTPEVLLVEDNPGDIRLVEEAFETVDTEVDLHAVTNGYEAVYSLKHRSTSESDSVPDLVLSDLHVPGKDGCEILESIRDEPTLRRIPVIILTDSESETDVERCYDAQANAYITKPTDSEGFVSLIRDIERFWFERVQLPSVSR